MAELASPRSGLQVENYRPVSLLAILGFGLACLSPLVYLMEAVWLVLLLPLPAFLLSSWARYRILRADGTLAGAGLARAGMAISLVCGLSWVTVVSTTYLILRAESKAQTDQFIELMRQRRDGLAFLLTVRPGIRPVSIKPEDLDPKVLRARYASASAGNQYESFLTADFPSMLLRSGSEAEWTPLGIQNWSYNQGSYIVRHRYRVQTPEISGEVVIIAMSQSVDTPTGPRREWQIMPGSLDLVPETVKPTSYGLDMNEARREASKAMEKLMGMIGLGIRDEALKVLGSSPDPETLANFDQLYKKLREGAGPHDIVKLQGRPAMCLKVVNQGPAWTFTFRGVVEDAQREVELDLVCHTDDISKGYGGWRVSDIKFLGVRKRQAESGGMPQPPSLPPPPKVPGV